MYTSNVSHLVLYRKRGLHSGRNAEQASGCSGSQGQGVPDPVYGEERTHRYGSGALLDQHLMRAIRFARWVVKELIRELTIAELGCKPDAR